MRSELASALLFLLIAACSPTDGREPTGRLGTAAFVCAEDDSLVVIDVDTGILQFQLEGPFVAASMAENRRTVAAIRVNETPIRVDLDLQTFDELQASASGLPPFQRWGRDSTWFTVATQSGVVLFAEGESQGRPVDRRVVESTAIDALAFISGVGTASRLIIEGHDGTERIEVPLERRATVNSYLREHLLLVESVDGEMLLRERDRWGNLIRELGNAAQQEGLTWKGSAPLSPSGTRTLMRSQSALIELDLVTGERTDFLPYEKATEYSADYLNEDTLLLLVVRNLDPVLDDTPDFAGSLEIATRGGERRELFRDRRDCLQPAVASTDASYAAVTCVSTTRIYSLDSGELVAAPAGRLLGFSSESDAAILTASDEEGSWLVVQSLRPEVLPLRRVAKISENGLPLVERSLGYVP